MGSMSWEGNENRTAAMSATPMNLSISLVSDIVSADSKCQTDAQYGTPGCPLCNSIVPNAGDLKQEGERYTPAQDAQKGL
jgi:hypothetical protein